MTLYRKYWWHINRWNATHWQEQISYLSYAGLITGTRNFNFFCWQGRKTLCFWCRVAFIMKQYWVVHSTKSSLANVRLIYEVKKGENVTCPTIGKKTKPRFILFHAPRWLGTWIEERKVAWKPRGNWGETGFFARSLFPGSPTFSLVLMHRPRAW